MVRTTQAVLNTTCHFVHGPLEKKSVSNLPMREKNKLDRIVSFAQLHCTSDPYCFCRRNGGALEKVMIRDTGKGGGVVAISAMLLTSYRTS